MLTRQVSVTTTITATAEGDETFAELRTRIAPQLPDFVCAGGMERIRPGDPVLGTKDEVHTRTQQAHVAFVSVDHHPRQTLQSIV